ncbi:Com family DNA-binding transcriptional regulator [Hydrogenophaga sp. A37]|uniref:Com family DNA-binding transcriptional regulator n=1 Tax=Hydrogenophaga sp. A37 TaxID=1945864 RepID=UPI000987B0D6|nr:Com family DNA-binding transcriptional regulator [Hydrogenophaga sp. A37]OOG84241.1 hypothetical protein B0E41_10860 [Hydrogenophaga sp. A37]
MNEIRCGGCHKKLGEGLYTALKIKCPRCGDMNHLRAESPQPACHRAPVSLQTYGQRKTNPTKKPPGA